MAPSRRAFTLIELLVATFVFLIGFVSIYGLLLTGAKLRKDGDLELRMANAGDHIAADMRMRIGTSDAPPSAFTGDGKPDTVDNDEVDNQPRPLYRCIQDPNLYYRIETCSNFLVDDQAPEADDLTSGYRARLLLVFFPAGKGLEPPTLADFAVLNRVRFSDPADPDAEPQRLPSSERDQRLDDALLTQLIEQGLVHQRYIIASR